MTKLEQRLKDNDLVLKQLLREKQELIQKLNEYQTAIAQRTGMQITLSELVKEEEESNAESERTANPESEQAKELVREAGDCSGGTTPAKPPLQISRKKAKRGS